MLERHADGSADESKRLWALYMLELWDQAFIGQVSARDEYGLVA